MTPALSSGDRSKRDIVNSELLIRNLFISVLMIHEMMTVLISRALILEGLYEEILEFISVVLSVVSSIILHSKVNQ